MKLVIAEKPSVAISIASALGVRGKQDGYQEGNGYVVSWCFGHLAGLADAAVYDPKYARWRKEDLPIVPERFRFCIGEDKKKQFELLKRLMHRADVTEVINACDAGREGELIFRSVFYLAGCKKPMKRLWISSMEDSAIREGFAQLKDGAEYDGLYQSAMCRAEADWLVGINATRLFSLAYGTKLNVGRVISPTLALMMDRETEIAGFAPETFYTVRLHMGFEAESEKEKNKTIAEAVADSCQGKNARVRSVERKEKQENPPALYDLTTLQRDANRILGYTAKQTLDYLQQLYEKKLCTYPRTDSRYLSDDMSMNVLKLSDVSAVLCQVESPEYVDIQRVCNSKKVTDHHAIVPTASATKEAFDRLPMGERGIMKLIAQGLLKSTSKPYRYAETVATIECAGHVFKAKGRTILDSGWKAYETGNRDKSQHLPDLSEGQLLQPSKAEVKEGKTTPPKHYTEDTLLSSMETAGAKDMPEDAERKGLGTPATRASILEKLVSAGFAERKKLQKHTHLIPTQVGAALIEVLPEQLKSPQLTAEWEHGLSRIQKCELDPYQFMKGITFMVNELVETYTPVEDADKLFPKSEQKSRNNNRTAVGKCPRCGHPVIANSKGFFCESRDCRFALWRDNRFFTAKQKAITEKIASDFLEEGRSLVRGCYSSKTGFYYDATVIMEDDGERTRFRMEFNNG